MLFKHASSGRTTGRIKRRLEQLFNTTPSLCVLFKIQLPILHPTRLKCLKIHASTAVHALLEAICRQCHCIPKSCLFDTVAEGISLVFESRHQALFLFWVLAARICVFFGYILGWWFPLVWICFQLEEKFHCLHFALSSSQP